MGRAEQTRNQILDAVEAIISDPHAKLTIDAVAAKAELSKGGVLYNFPSKNALMLGLVERLRDALWDDIQRQKQAHLETRSPTLGALIDIFRDWNRQHRSLAQALMAAVAQDETLKGCFDEVMYRIREQIKAEADNPVRAMIAMAALDGMHITRALGCAPYSDAETEAMLDEIALILRSNATAQTTGQ